ncbi:MAG: 30S ribosomal protein S16 [Thermoguttaceae bacterium]
MSVRIRMKKMGRKHRPFFRICAMELRVPRDGRVLEELGTYDPMVPETDARAILNSERIKYWLSVGAQPSDKVSVLIKKYGAEGTHVEAQRLALARLAQGKRQPPPAAARADEPAAGDAEAATEHAEATAGSEVAEAPVEPVAG